MASNDRADIPSGLLRPKYTKTKPGSYFLHDGLGSTAAVTDTSGAVVTTYEYDPYGNDTGTAGRGTQRGTEA